MVLAIIDLQDRKHFSENYRNLERSLKIIRQTSLGRKRLKDVDFKGRQFISLSGVPNSLPVCGAHASRTCSLYTQYLILPTCCSLCDIQTCKNYFF
jgi:hypothetical protein